MKKESNAFALDSFWLSCNSWGITLCNFPFMVSSQKMAID